MARPRRTDAQLVTYARRVLQQTQDRREFRQALAVLLPAELNASLEQTARVLGIGRATVPRLQSGFRRLRDAGPGSRQGWGGRRRTLMSEEEEQEFLRPWAEQALTGGVLVVSPIRAALAQRLGRKVATSVVYRFLARHGWRKVAPDTRHPKSDPQIQEAWKKNSRKTWRPCSHRKPWEHGRYGSCSRTRPASDGWYGFGAVGHRRRRVRRSTTATNGSSPMCMERSARCRGNWTGRSARR